MYKTTRVLKHYLCLSFPTLAKSVLTSLFHPSTQLSRTDPATEPRNTFTLKNSSRPPAGCVTSCSDWLTTLCVGLMQQRLRTTLHCTADVISVSICLAVQMVKMLTHKKHKKRYTLLRRLLTEWTGARGSSYQSVSAASAEWGGEWRLEKTLSLSAATSAAGRGEWWRPAR